MQLLVRVYAILTICVGLAFIIVGLLMGFDALSKVLDPNSIVIVNGIERSDNGAKAMFLIFPLILVSIGFVLCRLRYAYWRLRVQKIRGFINAFLHR